MSPSVAANGHDETSPLLLPTSTAGTAPLLGPSSATVADWENRHDDTSQNGATNNNEHDEGPNMFVIFPAIAIGVFLAAADSTIALVSYATISSDLDALNLASWIMTAYGLALASFQPLYGKLCDIFGRKACLLAAFAIFSLGCLACGLSRSIEELIAARLLQAIGGGGLGTVISILLTSLVSPEDRGVWQGILNLVYALGAGLGAPLGGLLTSSVGWRWSFFGQVPICLVAIVLVSICLDNDIGLIKDQNERRSLMSNLRRVDFLGALSIIVMIASFIYGLDRGSNISWIIPETYIAFAISVIAGVWFFYVESRIAREPIVPPAIAFSKELVPIYLMSFFCFVAVMGLDFILPLYYQARQQFSPQKASFYMLPAIVAGVASALATGFWIRRGGRYYWALLLASTLQILGGLAAFLFSGPVIEATPGLVASQVLTELGVSNFVVSALIGVIANSSDSTVAILTAIYYSIRNLGCVIGVSVVSTVIQQALRQILVVELQPFNVDIDAIVEEVRKSLDILDTLDPRIAAIVRECYGKAITRGFLVILVMAALSIIPALWVRGDKDKKVNGKSNNYSA